MLNISGTIYLVVFLLEGGEDGVDVRSAHLTKESAEKKIASIDSYKRSLYSVEEVEIEE